MYIMEKVTVHKAKADRTAGRNRQIQVHSEDFNSPP